MLQQGLAAVAMAVAAVSAHSQAVLVQEGFDDLSTLAARGWVQTNASAPVGAGGWFQGNDAIFGAQAGAPASYIGTNYLAGVEGGALANWLISPTFSTAAAGTVSLWARADLAAPYFDRIAAGFSAGSPATAAFTLAPAFTLGGTWTQYAYSFAAQGAGSVARFAIEYVGLDSSANYVGIDSFSVTSVAAPIPEPSTYALLALGIVGAGIYRRLRSA